MKNKSLIRLGLVPAFVLLCLAACQKGVVVSDAYEEGGSSGGTIPKDSIYHTETLATGTGPGFYEMHYMGNDQTNYSDNTAPELDAATWTVDGIIFYVRGAFRFDMSTLPAAAPVKLALLSIYSNHQPGNGDLVHANSGPENAFYIERIGATWSPATATWANQPPVDTAGRVLIPQTDSAFLDVVNIDVTAMVNNMISSGNYGFMLQLQNEEIFNSRIFYSSGNSEPSKHPKLVVSY